MFNGKGTSWHPYKIPKTPDVSGKDWGQAAVSGSDPYVLSPLANATSSKNPSGQVEWNRIPINDIINRLKEVEDKLEEVETRLTEVENRLDSASITAECSDGTVTVTLNL